MEYLGKALEDPLKYPPDKADADYLTIVRKVERNKVSGELTTSPDHVGYKDPSSSIQISCSSLRGVSPSKSKSGLQLHIKYWNRGSGIAKPQARTLVVRDLQDDGGGLLGNVYLACPQLTQ